MTLLRWGIAAAGKISHDFCVGLSTLPFDEHQILAVGARQKERATQFAKIHEIPQAFGSYEELANCKDVDIVYIGCLNPQHYEVAKLMLEHGKHVLCEKPLCMNRDQAKKLILYAEQKKLFLMEAVWSRFFPAYQYVRKQIETGVLGEIQHVEVSFGFPLNDVNRLQKKDLGGGVVLDLGVYTIQFSQWAFQEPPQKIVAIGELNAEGVDVDVKVDLHYTGGRKSKMAFSSKEEFDNKAVITGSKGQITLLNFWCPTKIIDIDGREKEWILPETKLKTNFMNSQGLGYEAAAARTSIMNGELQNKNMNHNESLLFAQIEDEIRKQVGVVYTVDV